MNTKECKCGSGKAQSEPLRGVQVETQLTPDDLLVKPEHKHGKEVSETEIEEAVVMVNPDVDSMDSRG